LGVISMGPVLAVLGVKLAVVEDLAAINRLAGRIPHMDERRMRSRAYSRTVSDKMLSKWGESGRKSACP
jgi:hypothetical protein